MHRDLLLDISRLIWRTWTGRLPTGIDRVCLAYVDRFASRAQAVVQRGNLRQILTPAVSDSIFHLILEGGPTFRTRAPRLAMRALVGQRGTQLGRDRLYLNVGHTGLDAPGLAAWCERTRIRPVYLIHDLIPLTHPEFCRVGEDLRHHRRMATALNSAHGVIGNSQATLDDFAAFAEAQGHPCPPSLAALLGGHPLPTDVPPIAWDRPHFVTLGTIEGRKNHALLLQLWRRMITHNAAACPKLVIIGQRGWEAQTALAMLDRLPLLAGHVEVIEDCADAELAGYLRGARALLMPSFAEGYGLPVVEALGVGTPVVASDLPVFRELAGDLPIYCDPLDGSAWMAAIAHHLQEGEVRRGQLLRVAGYTMPSWATHFAAVEPWLDRL